MRLVLASRKSDLARIQAYTVGEALKSAHKNLEISYQFRESLGDKNLTDPLWKMPEKGVFTQDFYDDLVSGKVDLVVHSWKDLPTEKSDKTEIAATMARGDMRDLLLFRKDQFENVKKTGVLRLYTSSPRRSYNLENFFKEGFPAKISKVEFVSVRGNVPTRIRKLLDDENSVDKKAGVHGLILAKAGLDRLLGCEIDEFGETQIQLRRALEKCLIMILPLHLNPTAAAQGALAIEIRSDRNDVKEILREIHDDASFQSVGIERSILGGLGGGCHQKIGVSHLRRSYGQMTFIRAHTDRGEKINSVEFSPLRSIEKVSRDLVFPLEPSEKAWFNRIPIQQKVPEGPLWLAKSQVLPEGAKLDLDRLVWVSGWETWKKLAQRGIWVTGGSESLGESEDPRLDILLKGPVKWTKLSHGGWPSGGKRPSSSVAMYELVPTESPPDLTGKTHFYWMSGTSFERALEIYPWIKTAHHFCGPGNTYERISTLLGKGAHLTVFPNHALWLKEVVK